MAMIRDDAVVLARSDYSETSQIVVVLTRNHGKIRGIAKGIKRSTKTRFAVGIDLLDLGTIVLTHRAERDSALATVTEWKQTRSLSGLREKLSRIQAGQYAAEISSQLTEDWDHHQGLFDRLAELLEALSDADEPLPHLVRYQLALLKAIGAIPRFDACVLCERDSALTHFSSIEGGMICRHCAPNSTERRRVTTATARALRGGMLDTAHDDHLGSRDDPPPGPVGMGPFRLLNYHIAHLMGRQPRLAAKLAPRPAPRATR